MSPRSNPKSLNILVVNDEVYNSPAIQRFIEKGHNVSLTGINSDVDVIIGPRCWRIDPQLKLGQDATVEESLERQLEMMEKGVRNVKYPKVKDEPK